MNDGSESSDAPFPSDEDVDSLLAEFEGDYRMAIKALLHDVASLAADYGLSVSRGFIRRALEPRVATR